MGWITSSSGCIVTCDPESSSQSLLRASNMLKHWFLKGKLFTDGMALLQNLKGVCCNLLIQSCQNIQTASPSVADIASTIISVWSHGLSVRVVCKADWTCWRIFSCSGRLSNLLIATFRSLNKWVSVVYPHEVYIKMQRGPFLEAPDQQFTFYLWKDILISSRSLDT